MKKIIRRSAQVATLSHIYHILLTATPLIYNPIPHMIGSSVGAIIGTIETIYKKKNDRN